MALRRVALAATALALAGAGRPAGLGEVSDLRHWSYADYTRVVVELTRAADAAGSALAPGGGAPARLYFDLPGIWVGTSRDEPIPVGDGLLRRVRVGQNTLDTTRVVLDLERPGRYRVLRLAGPERVVIDVFADAGPGARRRARATPPMDLRPVRTVVLDAGHGGEDPGAIGVSGLREKDVALRLARLLRPRLVARGFEVVLTRDGDRTLSLLERTALAEGAGGDVLVSLHANAARNRRAAGVEIYTLDEDAQRQTLRLAARENGVALAELDPLQRLLTRLRVAEASQRSERLADLAQREIVSGMAGRWPSVRGPGRRRGPFYVLYLSDMPAILVEAGFVTHRGDARRLRDPDYLEALAEEIADALVRFRDGAGPLVAEARP